MQKNFANRFKIAQRVSGLNSQAKSRCADFIGGSALGIRVKRFSGFYLENPESPHGAEKDTRIVFNYAYFAEDIPVILGNKKPRQTPEKAV